MTGEWRCESISAVSAPCCCLTRSAVSRVAAAGPAQVRVEGVEEERAGAQTRSAEGDAPHSTHTERAAEAPIRFPRDLISRSKYIGNDASRNHAL